MRVNFLKCIQGKVETDKLPPRQVENLYSQYETLYAQYIKSMGDIDAAKAAADRVVAARAAALMEKKLNTYKSILHNKQSMAKLAEDAAKFKTPFREQSAVLMQRAGDRASAIFETTLAYMTDFVEANRAKYAGLSIDQSAMPDVVRELFGQNTGNKQAKLFAKMQSEGRSYAVNRLKKAGGIMGEIDGYVAQRHDRDLIKAAGSFDNWFNDISKGLDRSKMINKQTGLPYTDAELRKVSEFIYTDIITDGNAAALARLEKGLTSMGFGGAFQNRRAANRFFYFKDGDSFLEYNRKYGSGDEGLYDDMITSFESLSKDTAVLELLGPRPASWLSNVELQMAARGEKGFDGMLSGSIGLKEQYKVLTGYTDQGTGDLGESIHKGLSNLIMLRVSSLLGSASIAALGDTTFLYMTAKRNGLPAFNVLETYAKLINPTSNVDRQMMRNAGFIADMASGSAIAQARINSDIKGSAVTQGLARFTIEASGLGAMTRAAENAIAWSAMSNLAILKDVPFNKLDDSFRNALEAFDITAKDWAQLKTAATYTPKDGIVFLRPSDLADVSVANKLNDWIFAMRRVAVNKPGLKTRALTTMGERRGSAVRTLAQSAFFLKGFPITVMLNYMIPAVKKAKIAPMLKSAAELDASGIKRSWAEAKFDELGMVTIPTTMIGALTLQINEMLSGKEPREMDQYTFWKDAARRGGGFGLLGDYLFADYNINNKDGISDELGAFFGGGIADPLSDIISLAGAATTFERDEISKELFDLLKANTPARTLWYSKLVTERLIFDQIETLANPNHEKDWVRAEKALQKRTGQKLWWERGEVTP
jgi:hypothetical protein